MAVSYLIPACIINWRNKTQNSRMKFELIAISRVIVMNKVIVVHNPLFLVQNRKSLYYYIDNKQWKNFQLRGYVHDFQPSFLNFKYIISHHSFSKKDNALR